MNDKIDLESDITAMYQTADDLELFLKQYYEKPRPMTEDEVFGIVDGIRLIHLMKVEKLMDTYCRKIELDQYCTDPEKLAARDQLFAMITPNKKGKKKK